MDLSNPGIEPGSPALQADSLPNELRPNKKDFKIFFCFPRHHAASPFQVFAQTVHPEIKPSSPSHLLTFHLITLRYSGGKKKEVLVAQLCVTLCHPMDYSLPGSSMHGILQARILKWLPCPPPVDLPDPGIKPKSPALQANSLPLSQ